MVVLGFISSLSVIIPLFLGILKFRGAKIEMKIFVVYFILSCLMDAILIHQAYNAKNNIWLFHYFTPVEYGIYSLVFSFWQEKRFIKNLLLISIPAFVIYFIFAMGLFETPEKFDSFSASLESLILIGISTRTLVKLGGENNYRPLRDYRFWVCCGVLIYFAGNLLLFSWSRVIVIWWIHNALNIASNLLFAVSFLCPRHQ